MSTLALLRDELKEIPELVPEFRFSKAALPGFREARDGMVQLLNAEEFGVQRQAISVPGEDGDVDCLLYQPAERGELKTGGYLHIHGGGYIIGTAAMSDEANVKLCAKLGIVILSVDYRLAPEHPVPAGLNDCYAGLAWLYNHADELKVDRDRIAIGGESAGGGLAAALAIHARDKGEYSICHQHLTYPMLDDRTGSEAHPGDPLTGEFVWTRASNQFGWQCYLGDAEPAAPHVPARVESFSDLPATWMFTVGLDLFRDENITYARALMAAGVGVELDVMPGACHGFQMIPGTRIGRLYNERHRAALARALAIEL